jgi:hypothetical protein
MNEPAIGGECRAISCFYLMCDADTSPANFKVAAFFGQKEKKFLNACCAIRGKQHSKQTTVVFKDYGSFVPNKIFAGKKDIL